ASREIGDGNACEDVSLAIHVQRIDLCRWAVGRGHRQHLEAWRQLGQVVAALDVWQGKLADGTRPCLAREEDGAIVAHGEDLGSGRVRDGEGTQYGTRWGELDEERTPRRLGNEFGGRARTEGEDRASGRGSQEWSPLGRRSPPREAAHEVRFGTGGATTTR